MKRRIFLQAIGLSTLTAANFQAFGIMPASQINRFTKNKLDGLTIDTQPLTPQKIPQIINIFLYGGPSELAGNLTNIEQIRADSKGPYPENFVKNAFNSAVTPNDFWREAGGQIMEELLVAKQMSIYRTINRLGDDNKAHGRSVLQNLKGHVDPSYPGIATTLAHILTINNPFDKPIELLNFPIISLEGESPVFDLADLNIPTALRPVAINPVPFRRKIQNPYAHADNPALVGHPEEQKKLNALALEKLARNRRFLAINEAFQRRATLAENVDRLLNINTIDTTIAQYNQSLAIDQQIQYNEDNFGHRLKIATSLALANPETIYISVGSGGLGGWDDHSNALNAFPDRLNKLMQAVQSAMRHINSAKQAGIAHAGNIIINIYGDFGRNVNINSANGWDHGNNQNLYTFGGENIRGNNALGKIIGRTIKTGPSKDNRQYTTPSNNSYQCEPFAIAASIYQYFGVQNPDVLTGVTAIDEAQPSERLAND